MQLRNKYYPYPVICENGESYVGSSFTTEISQRLDGFNVVLSLSSFLNDIKIASLIEQGQAIIVHHVECPNTCYRRIVKTTERSIDILMKDADIDGIVQVCSFIVANQRIDGYTNDSFSSDFRGWKFDLEKGCIMAVGKQFNVRINKFKDDLANTSSIFSIVKLADPNETSMKVDLGQHKIVVELPEKTLNQYKSIQNNMDMQTSMHSMIIIPALVYVLGELKCSSDSLFEFEGKRWFQALRKACKKIGVELDDEGVQKFIVLVIAQKLLNNPIVPAIEFQTGLGDEYED